MPKTTGNGLNAMASRKPSKMPPTKSVKDSGMPNGQYSFGPGPATAPRSKSGEDSGKPNSNR